MEGVDYSFARPGGATIIANGRSFAMRYLYPGGGKGITASEYADLKAHGVAVGGIYEGASGGMLNGFAQGVADAKVAVGQIAAVGLPVNLPVYFTVDFDANAAQLAACDSYLDGAASVIGRARVGVYAGLAQISHFMANGKASWFWQTYAWSSGQLHAGVHIYQYLNGQWGDTVDLVRSYQTDFGQDTGAFAQGHPVVSIRKKQMVLFWDTVDGAHPNSGWLFIEGEGFRTLASMDEYDFWYRLINSDQTKKPPFTDNTSVPDAFYGSQIETEGIAVLARTPQPAPPTTVDPTIDYDALATQIVAKLPANSGATKAEVVEALNSLKVTAS